MKIPLFTLLGTVIVAPLTGCASQPLTLSPVGPQPVRHTSAVSNQTKGYLQVFSATEKSIPFASDDPTVFNLHSGYDINDQSGKTLRFVPNHASNMDEQPDQVALPPGTYNVVARSSCCGQVTVPVIIQGGQTTVVHLDENWWPSSKTPTNQLVYLPDGEAVGWSRAGTRTRE